MGPLKIFCSVGAQPIVTSDYTIHVRAYGSYAACTNNNLADTAALSQAYANIDNFLGNDQAPGHTETLVFTESYKIYIDNEGPQRQMYPPNFNGAMGLINNYCGAAGSGYYYDPPNLVCYGRDLTSAQSCPPHPPSRFRRL